LRKSNTEPIIRLIVEASDAELAKKLMDFYKTKLQTLIS